MMMMMMLMMMMMMMMMDYALRPQALPRRSPPPRATQSVMPLPRRRSAR
jgi:hypothetical protein